MAIAETNDPTPTIMTLLSLLLLFNSILCFKSSMTCSFVAGIGTT